ncbi:ras-related protein rab-18 [Plakobranchus ocellatus]|uniref:Ras-related protein rab-18 n=1 Tax=Plakobranchus ocellatus TaxID=259542 RepID=A0AAV4CYQ8_9GAST|nr:ras-related protein rab-18 [Plakobranchus ocellatus]
MNGKSQHYLKLAILGEKQVGKTSLVTRYTLGDFNPHYLYTKAGGDITHKDLQIQGKPVHVTIIDSAGHKYVRSLIKTLYRDVHGIMLVYDVTRKNTFERLDDWLREIERVNTSHPLILLVGNKMDLEKYSQVDIDQAEMSAHRHNLGHIQCSAKTGLNVVKAFETLLHSTVLEKLPNEPNNSIKLKGNNSDGGRKKNSFCCSI